MLARGWDAVNKDSIYLIRDEVLQFFTKLNSTFVYSQDYLLDELIPGLIRTRNTLLMDSTKYFYRYAWLRLHEWC